MPMKRVFYLNDFYQHMFAENGDDSSEKIRKEVEMEKLQGFPGFLFFLWLADYFQCLDGARNITMNFKCNVLC